MAMAGTGLKRKLVGEIEIRVGGGDAFHDMMMSKPHHVSNANPLFVQDCELHEGSFGQVGSIICWNYTLDGKAQSGKEKIEAIDEDKKMIKFNVIEGDVLLDYKSFDITFQVIPEDEHTSIVRWTFEYEKLHQNIPEPSSLMDSMVILAKEIDDHHHQGQ